MEAGGARVVIVDDGAASRRLLEVRLRALDCEVATAADGREALAAIQQEPPALVLLDLEMPRMPGMELLRALRREGSDVPVIVITAHRSIESVGGGVKEGAFDFIPKPFDPKHLELVVRKALDRARLVESNQLLRAALAARAPETIGEGPPIRRAAEMARKAAAAK